MELNRASEVSAADWLSQTHVENYRNFLREAIQFFLEVEIPIKGARSSSVEHAQSGRQVSFAGHRSQVIVLPIQKVSQTLLTANLRPKNVCLGLIRPKVSFYKYLGYFLYQ